MRRGPWSWSAWSNTVIGVLVLGGGAIAHGIPPGWGMAWVVYVLARFQVNESRTEIILANLPGYEDPVVVQVVKPATVCQHVYPWAAPACVLLVDWLDVLLFLDGMVGGG